MKWEIHNCPHCGAALTPVKDLLGGVNKYFAACSRKNCRTIVNVAFLPMDYQLDFLAQSEKGGRLALFGGYGVGKTVTNGMALLLHAISVVKGESLIGAQSWKQMIRTNMKEMAEIIPELIVRKFGITMSENAGNFNVILQNGHLIHASVLTDEEKIRSMTLSAAWIEEASVVKYSLFHQIESARLRHDNAKVFAKDEHGNPVKEQFIDNAGYMRTRTKELPGKHLLLLSSNPDPGWIRTMFLFATPSQNLRYYGTDELVRKSLILDQHDKNSRFHSYVIPSTANYHLPIDFLENLTTGRSKKWIDRYVNGSFSFAEGLVYPDAMDHVVEPFDIPNNWRRIISTDFGRREATAHLVGAINPEDGVLYLYDCFKLSNGDVPEWIAGFRRLYDPVPASLWLYPPIADPAGQSAGQADSKSWFELYADHGIYLIPSKTGKASELGIAPGIALVNEYFGAGKIKFFSTLTPFIAEIKEYKYRTESLMELESESRKDERPVAYNDHLMDAFRGMVSMLPRDVTFNLASFQPTYIDASSLRGQAFAITNKYGVDLDPSDPEFWKPMSNDDPYAFENGYEDDEFMY